MKTSTIALLFLISASKAFSGGSVGGNPPALQDFDALSLMSLSIDQLPKVYADPGVFRRASARLEVAGVETVPMMLSGEVLQVRKLRDSIVDDRILKQIVPEQ